MISLTAQGIAEAAKGSQNQDKIEEEGEEDDDDEDLCVAEVSGCATTHDNARNKHCR